MRRSLFAIAVVFSPLAALAGTPQTVTLKMQNMTCSVCPLTVKKALEKLQGVTSVKVSLGTKTATATFDPDKANADALIKATAEAGYPASVE